MATIDDLAESLASQLPLTKAEAFRGVRAVVSALMESLLKGEAVSIAGIGRFTCSKVDERPEKQIASLRFSGRPPQYRRLAEPYQKKPIAFTIIDIYLSQQRGETYTSRWEFMPPSSAKAWESRARVAASHVIGKTIVDIGCGEMLPEKFLPEGTVYVPMDVVRRDDRTKILDLNTQDLPEFEADTVLLLGVLEYVHAPERLLRNLIGKTKRLVTSYYKKIDHNDADLFMSWVNKTDWVGFEAMLTRSGWKLIECVDYGNQAGRIFIAEPASSNSE